MCALLFVLGCLFGCMAACPSVYLRPYVCVLWLRVCVFGWKYYLCSIIPGTKRHKDLSGRHIKLLPSVVLIP